MHDSRKHLLPERLCPSRSGWLLLALWFLPALWLAHYRQVVLWLLVGPTALDPGDVPPWAELADGQERYVTVSWGKVVEGDGWKRVSPYSWTLGRQPYFWYAVAPVGRDRVLLVCAAWEDGRPPLTGILEPCSPYERHYLLPRLREQFPGRVFLPYRLNSARPLLPLGFTLSFFPVCWLLILAVRETARAWQAAQSAKPQAAGGREAASGEGHNPATC